jgi:hypothetical protein
MPDFNHASYLTAYFSTKNKFSSQNCGKSSQKRLDFFRIFAA